MLNEEVFAGITWGQALIVTGWVLGAVVLGKVVQIILTNMGKSKRFEGKEIIQAAFKAFARPVPFLFFTLGLFPGLGTLQVGEGIARILADCLSVLLTVAVTFFIYSMVDVLDFAISHYTKKTRTKMDDMMAPMVRKSLRVVIIVLALVQVAQILSDKPITSILAGLGVGGLAVALAAQETIKNFFGSLVIFADKPFELGERIVVGGHDGAVEEVGFRSTRIRTLDGHLVTVPNGELANLMIQNIGKRAYIKRVMNVTITYDTPPEKVQQALDILKELLDNHEGMNADFPPRVFFNNFNDCSLNILAIYWYHPPEYWDYLAFSEKLNLELLKRYNEAGIEFAFPTQTLHVNGLDAE
ncbi:mechanosensitive ion channel family protein [Pontiella sulfatireligans]|uniref:Low conductance mechanosensitive channel YnaI n=1 Tax=Pontiella sulfatireligans TaxID=2750658 RepID=A0A6C2UEW2_9BACT|nr:mechanosensitive ion channel family protein [Pontiella sulfatireligans]VGO18413.1 Low conductance mechanosensitive channel YnaI [Pontiella sulfatireligans]